MTGQPPTRQPAASRDPQQKRPLLSPFNRGIRGALAERQGFEPWVPREGYAGLASRCFRPLSHLSVAARNHTRERGYDNVRASLSQGAAPPRSRRLSRIRMRTRSPQTAACAPAPGPRPVPGWSGWSPASFKCSSGTGAIASGGGIGDRTGGRSFQLARTRLASS